LLDKLRTILISQLAEEKYRKNSITNYINFLLNFYHSKTLTFSMKQNLQCQKSKIFEAYPQTGPGPCKSLTKNFTRKMQYHAS